MSSAITKVTVVALALGAVEAFGCGNAQESGQSVAEKATSCGQDETLATLLALDEAAMGEAWLAIDASTNPEVLAFAHSVLSELQRVDAQVRQVASAGRMTPAETDLSRQILANTIWNLQILQGAEVAMFDQHFSADEVLDNSRALGVLEQLPLATSPPGTPQSLAPVMAQMKTTFQSQLTMAVALQKQIVAPPPPR